MTGEPSSFDWLPGLLREIAEVAGLEAALKIAEMRGGQETYFPARAHANHWLVTLLGREAAQKLCKHFRSTSAGGIKLIVPIGPRRRMVFFALLDSGLPVATAARRAMIHERTAYAWMKEGRREFAGAARAADERQLKLF